MKLIKVIISGFLIVGVIGTTPLALAQTSGRIYDTQYQGSDLGRYRGNRVLQEKINSISSRPIETSVRIPVLLGVKLSDLDDTWGDARSSGRTHEGIDIMASRGTPVVSPTDAVVTTVENSGNGGMHVFTANPGGERFFFAHLDSFAPGLAEGQTINKGDLIGYVGNTGNASAGPTHLHFGIYTDDRATTNPFPRLNQEFTLEEKIASITKILNGAPDQTILAQVFIAQSQNTFVEAQTQNIILPQAIALVLGEQTTITKSVKRTLRIGMKGEDVKILQTYLGLTADGSFGPKTKAAVIAFQVNHGLVADGVFGAKSRLAMSGSPRVNTLGCTAGTLYNPITGVKCS